MSLVLLKSTSVDDDERHCHCDDDEETSNEREEDLDAIGFGMINDFLSEVSNCRIPAGACHDTCRHSREHT